MALRYFDPGTQGEHKLIRGFYPVLTHSATPCLRQGCLPCHCPVLPRRTARYIGVPKPMRWPRYLLMTPIKANFWWCCRAGTIPDNEFWKIMINVGLLNLNLSLNWRALRSGVALQTARYRRNSSLGWRQQGRFTAKFEALSQHKLIVQPTFEGRQTLSLSEAPTAVTAQGEPIGMGARSLHYLASLIKMRGWWRGQYFRLPVSLVMRENWQIWVQHRLAIYCFVGMAQWWPTAGLIWQRKAGSVPLFTTGKAGIFD